ncbi:hypothetical protein BN874_2300009 [Candidatus Contendobacter odensis Run_B_J11]|uniref:Uncharacterized protein n=1 Tax=Candidatus Contendobacter odensis Run_B_J11 TaxID=1400861 RepID=A0A7U7J4I7_9GAMM|nr:hypothetical protein BN874_2300009 [Candidatus Contendobacter odensis Run_B_J11]
MRSTKSLWAMGFPPVDPTIGYHPNLSKLLRQPTSLMDSSQALSPCPFCIQYQQPLKSPVQP